MLSKDQIIELEKQEGKKLLDLRRQYNALVGGATSYSMVSYKTAHSYEAEARRLGVSKVARGTGGFMRVYQRNPSAAKLKRKMIGKISWYQRRNNFVARHLKQYKKNKTLRRWLAMMMWAYRAGPKPKGKSKSKRRLRGGACWPGYERVPGTAEGAKGSCRKKGTGKTKRKRKTVSSRRKRGGSSKRKRRGSSKRKRGSSKRKRRGSSKRKRRGSKRKKKS